MTAHKSYCAPNLLSDLLQKYALCKSPNCSNSLSMFLSEPIPVLILAAAARGQHNGWKAKQYFDKTNDGDVEKIGAVVGVVTSWSVSLTEEKTRPLQRLPTPYLATIVYHPGLEELELIIGMNLGKNRPGFGVCWKVDEKADCGSIFL